jgi:hypothetical protein
MTDAALTRDELNSVCLDKDHASGKDLIDSVESMEVEKKKQIDYMEQMEK